MGYPLLSNIVRRGTTPKGAILSRPHGRGACWEWLIPRWRLAGGGRWMHNSKTLWLGT
jgi:hypothetical protein